MTQPSDQNIVSSSRATDSNAKERADYTTGSIYKAIIKMGMPSAFGFLIQHVYLAVDMYWVSSLSDGETAVAAITFFNAILWFFFAFNQLVGPGSVAVISRRYGEKEWHKASKAIKEALLLKFCIGFLITIVGLLVLEPLLALMGADGVVLEKGLAYGTIMFINLPIMYTTYSVFTAMRGIANPNMALWLMLGSSLLNMILDPLFIFGHLGLPAMGIEGAAIASGISFLITLFVGIALFQRGITNVRINIFGGQKVALDSMLKLVKIGVPSWLGDLSFSGSRLVITPIIASFGTGVVAAWGIGGQIYSLGIMILVGIGLGLSSLIGQTLGAGKIERAKETADKGLILSVSLMVVYGVIMFFSARFLMGLFLDNPESIDAGVMLLKIVALGFPFIGAFIMLEQIHMGVGLNTPTMIILMIHSWGLQVLPVLFVVEVLGLGQTAVWFTLTAAGFVSASMFYIYYRRGRWLTVKV